MKTKDMHQKKLSIQEIRQQQYLFIYEAVIKVLEFSLFTGCGFGLLMLLFEVLH